MFNGKKKRPPRKKTMAFVDYEYWFYSYKTRLGERPDPMAWRNEIEEKYSPEEIMVFGDFTAPEIRGELARLREITSTIIETGNTYLRYKKDLTDFVMLDYIYQCADTRRDIGRYIIFTGDGHFQSVVRYLVQKKKREVIVYGVKDSFSRQLREAASYAVELPNDPLFGYYRQIIKNIAEVKSDPSVIPTFNGTVDTVSRANGLSRSRTRDALIKLINSRYIFHREFEVEKGKIIKILDADWEKLARDGMLSQMLE